MREFEYAGTRDGFKKALKELAENHPHVVALDADLADSTGTRVMDKNAPERFFEMGISENDMVCTAAGMARMGLRPIVSSFSMFLAGRSWEHIRNSLGYNKLNVVISASHSGVTVGKDGPSHQIMCDISNMVAIPNMTVIVPADAHQTYKACMYGCLKHDGGPFFYRMCREKTPVVTSETDEFAPGRAQVLQDGGDVTLIACGVIFDRVFAAADRLAADGLSVRVINNYSMKPLDTGTITRAAKETGAIVTVEEGTFYGGLGSIVATHLMQEAPSAAALQIVAVNDRYASSGDGKDMLDLVGVTADNIYEKALKAISLKPGGH